MTESLRLQVAALMIVGYLLINYFSARRNIQANHTFSAALILATVNAVVDLVHSFLHARYGVANELLFKVYLCTLLMFVLCVHQHIAKKITEKGGRINVSRSIWYLVVTPELILLLFSEVSHGGMEGGVISSSLGQTFLYILLGVLGTSCIVMIVINWKSIGRQDRMTLLLAVICLNLTYIAQGLTSMGGESVVSLGNTVIMLIIYMVTDNPDMLLIKKLQDERDRANAANSSKSSFVAHVSHEIRTPINAIIGMNEMILRETEDDNTKLYANDISQAAQKLYGIINNVLDISKMESGKLEIFPTEYKLNQLVYDAVFVSMPQIRNKQLKFFVNMNSSMPSVYFGDDIHIKQVLSNLISNAVKYTHEGFIKLSINGSFSGELMDLTFEVRDSGIGIKEEDISRLFEAFERIEESRNRNIEGTGLGMTITNNLLRLMGSRLNVSSVYGEGSVFSFTVTQRIVSREPVGDYGAFSRQQETDAQVEFTAPLVKLLVVDDNILNRRVFKSLLARTEIMVDEANGGYECLEKIKNETYDIIFLDHLMPDLDGVDTLLKMREKDDHKNVKTPVIMLTANALDGIQDVYNQAGFNAYLSKPIFSNALEKIIRTYVPSYKIIPKDKNATKATKEVTYSENWQDELPKIRGIDWEEAIKHLPTEEILKMTLQEFYANIEKDASDLDKYVENIELDDNLEMFRIKVHALKGQAAMIGAEMLAEGAKELGMAAMNGKTDIINEKYPYMVKYYRSFGDKLACFGFEGTENNHRIDYEQVKSLLEMIRMEMHDMNKQNALDLIIDLNEYKFERAIKAKIMKLKHAIEEFDSESVESVVDELINKIKTLENS